MPKIRLAFLLFAFFSAFTYASMKCEDEALIKALKNDVNKQIYSSFESKFNQDENIEDTIKKDLGEIKVILSKVVKNSKQDSNIITCKYHVVADKNQDEVIELIAMFSNQDKILDIRILNAKTLTK